VRYKDTGNVHKDFHLATQTTIDYVLAAHGIGFLRELFSRTAREVYRDIRGHLERGDASALAEHTAYYIEREGGALTIERQGDDIVIEIRDCPAVRHVDERGTSASVDFCLQTALMNEAWAKDTPFEITTELTGRGTCRQTIRPRGGQGRK
jgi:hypothetical protein